MTPYWKGSTQRAVLMIAVLLYLTAGVFVWLRLSYPSDGTRLWVHPQDNMPSSVSALPLTPQNSDLRSTDRITAIEGYSIQYWADVFLRWDSFHPVWAFDQVVIYTVFRDGQSLDIPVKLRSFPVGQVLGDNIVTVLFLVAVQAGSGWLFAHRPHERAAQTLLLASSSLTAFSMCWFLGTDMVLFVSANGIWLYYRLATFVLLMIMCSSLLHFTLLLPHLNSRRPLGRQLVWFIYAIPYPAYTVYLLLIYTSHTLEWIQLWEHGIWFLMIACFATGLIAAMISYRKLRDVLARRWLAIVMVAFIITALLAITFGWLPMWISRETDTTWRTMPLIILPLAVGLVFAILFYRLFDFRFVIQRALVWSALTAMLIAVYITIVGMLSLLFNRPNDPLFSLVATGVAAVLSHPFRERMQGIVNRLIYGERDTPYKVMMSLTKRLEAALAPPAALNMIVQTIGKALKLPYAAIELIQDNNDVMMAEFGSRDAVPSGEWLSFPLEYAEETVGRLVVAPHSSGETLTLQDHRLISGLIHEAEVMIQTARLTVDLQRSREKIVTSREEERRRLRRDLHDGLGPSLASLMLEVDAARNFLHEDVSKAEYLLCDLKTQIQNAISDVRRLVYELRPPALDELGLVAALQEKARQLGQSAELLITVDASPLLPPLPAAVEGALYRITLEAIANTIRHAHATVCSVRLYLNDELHLEIWDNGHGLPEKPHYGIGLNSMRERVAELGGKFVIENAAEGGARVRATLPIRHYSSSLSVPMKG
jgi:two-component system NarL family sensor kinase